MNQWTYSFLQSTCIYVHHTTMGKTGKDSKTALFLLFFSFSFFFVFFYFSSLFPPFPPSPCFLPFLPSLPLPFLQYITSGRGDLNSRTIGDFSESKDLSHEQVSFFADDVFDARRIGRKGRDAGQWQRGKDAVRPQPLGLEADVDAQKAAHVRQTNRLLRVRTDRVAFVVQEHESGVWRREGGR